MNIFHNLIYFERLMKNNLFLENTKLSKVYDYGLWFMVNEKRPFLFFYKEDDVNDSIF